MRLNTGLDYFLNVPLDELNEIMNEVIDLCQKSKKYKSK